MTPAGLLAELGQRGIAATARGERLVLKGPTRNLPVAFRAEVVRLRAAVVAILTPAPGCAECGALSSVMFAMEPGPVGDEWRLCARCWR